MACIPCRYVGSVPETAGCGHTPTYSETTLLSVPQHWSTQAKITLGWTQLVTSKSLEDIHVRGRLTCSKLCTLVRHSTLRSTSSLKRFKLHYRNRTICTGSCTFTSCWPAPLRATSSQPPFCLRWCSLHRDLFTNSSRSTLPPLL
jgi:hypothetical protein